MNSQRFAVIHIGNSRRQAQKPKLAKEYACPIAGTGKAANLKTDRIEHKNRQCTMNRNISILQNPSNIPR